MSELLRIAAAEHPDPHSVLGPHMEDGALVIRVFRPDALEIMVVPDDPTKPPRPLERRDPPGLFEARFRGIAAGMRYSLDVRRAGGITREGDPYSFPPSVGDLDLHLAAEGTHERIDRILGAHLRVIAGVSGAAFAVWAPNARRVSVVGDFNQWDGRVHAMRRMGGGIWEIFLPDVGEGALYKYEILTQAGDRILKADPYGQAMELRPDTASKVVQSRYQFTDDAWMEERGGGATGSAQRRPLSIYEVHLGSWRRAPRQPGEEGMAPPAQERRWMTYRELAHELVDYVADMGFSHIELMPVMEHPYDGSWGYQVSGYFAPTSRYGDPDDLRYFIDRCHAKGIGVILDWTPAHFPKDAFALGRFDGTALYEHWDPRMGEHRQWQTYIFHYGRFEVLNFLLSNALYWLTEFHADGLRVDAVASMLYLDYGASHPGEWAPNKYGGRENLEAIAFLQKLCDLVKARVPGAILCAEESTTWPGVTRPTYLGGLGFDFKWNMGWMHDTLDYFSFDSIHRTFHHNRVTFGLMYAFSEKFLLPLSHDEVVHLKKSLLSKMPGDRWKMHANLRALYGYMWAHPGKKLLFMGGEIGQWSEWGEAKELEWARLEEPDGAGLQRLVRDLNALYNRYPALHELDDAPEGFRWIDANDALQSVASFVRFASAPASAPVTSADPVAPVTDDVARAAVPAVPPGIHVVFVGNFTPVPRYEYRIGVPRLCRYIEVLNSDAVIYGGSGMGNLGTVNAEPVPYHGYPQSIVLTLPPLAALYFVPELVPELDREPLVETTAAEIEEARL
jgi:1,4-alpha-glucan branching enzyme